MRSPDEHVWAQMAGSVDACQCVRCGMVASNTAIAAGVGVPTSDGWAVGEFAAALPGCDELDLDAELARLLAGEI
jgi:hypothetical protein